MDDPLEHEADRVAARVLAGDARASGVAASSLVRSTSNDTMDACQPLPEDARPFFEKRLGVDLGAVRLHTGPAAAASAAALSARAYSIDSDIVFADGEHASGSLEGAALLTHELVHVAQWRRGASSSTMRRAPPKTPTLEQRVSVLELDAKWRKMFGPRMAVYRGGAWLLFGAFQGAVKSFNEALAREGQEAALMDQVGAAILSLGAAGVAEPLLTAHLGGLSVLMDDIVEYLENPLITAAQGAASLGAAGMGAGRSRQAPATTLPAPSGHQVSGGAQDPLLLLSQNMVLLEDYTRRIEQGSPAAAASLTAADLAKQEQSYQALYDELGTVALTSVDQLKDAAELSLTIERHFWAAWIRTFPPYKGLFWGRQISLRMKQVGLEERAHVGFDTESLVFQSPEPSPQIFDSHLRLWAADFAEPLTR